MPNDKIRHDGKGNLKKHDGSPVKAGESVFSKNLWDKLIIKEGSETKIKNKLKITNDNRMAKQ